MLNLILSSVVMLILSILSVVRPNSNLLMLDIIMLHVTMICLIMLGVVIQGIYPESLYTEYHYAKCHSDYAEYHYAGCHYDECLCTGGRGTTNYAKLKAGACIRNY
jgi:hypothetical protein